MDIRHVFDTSIRDGFANSRGHFFDAGKPAHVLGKNRLRYRGADGQTIFVHTRSFATIDLGKDVQVRRDHPVTAAGQRDRNLQRGFAVARALLDEEISQNPIGQDSPEIVDAAVPLGLSNDRDDFVRAETLGFHSSDDAVGILYVLHRNFDHNKRHGGSPDSTLQALTTPRPGSKTKPRAATAH